MHWLFNIAAIIVLIALIPFLWKLAKGLARIILTLVIFFFLVGFVWNLLTSLPGFI